MSPAETILDDAIDLLVASDVAGVGAAWIPIGIDGVHWPSIDDPIANWRQSLVVDARPIRVALERRLDEVVADGGSEVELMPGVWAIGSVHRQRQDEHIGVALLATDDLRTLGSFSMVCNAARLDETLIRGLAERAAGAAGQHRRRCRADRARSGRQRPHDRARVVRPVE